MFVYHMYSLGIVYIFLYIIVWNNGILENTFIILYYKMLQTFPNNFIKQWKLFPPTNMWNENLALFLGYALSLEHLQRLIVICQHTWVSFIHCGNFLVKPLSVMITYDIYGPRKT